MLVCPATGCFLATTMYPQCGAAEGSTLWEFLLLFAGSWQQEEKKGDLHQGFWDREVISNDQCSPPHPRINDMSKQQTPGRSTAATDGSPSWSGVWPRVPPDKRYVTRTDGKPGDC